MAAAGAEGGELRDYVVIPCDKPHAEIAALVFAIHRN